ncbi:MAG: PilN domain-containing protein [Lysobacterales bacterium]
MAKINLLPWRAERRKQREREFGVLMLAALGLGAVLVFAGVWYMNQRLAGQQARNDLLNAEISQVNVKIKEIDELRAKRDTMLQRKDVIERLRASGSQTVRMLDALAKSLPEGVTLTNIRQAGEQLTLEGLAQSQARISAYMLNLESSEWLSKPDLQKSEASGPNKNARYKFTMLASLRKSKEELEAAGEAEAGPASGPNIPPPPAQGG